MYSYKTNMLTSKDIIKSTGLTRMQAQFLVERETIIPSKRPNGTGRARTFEDFHIPQFKLAKLLLEIGIPHIKINEIFREIRTEHLNIRKCKEILIVEYTKITRYEESKCNVYLGTKQSVLDYTKLAIENVNMNVIFFVNLNKL